MKKFQPSPALVISLIALFVALGGTSYAAINSLPKNSVGPAPLKKGAVTSSKIAKGLKVKPQAWQSVGAAGKPAFMNGWSNEDPVDEVTAAFYKDPFGVVHLKGIIAGGSDSTVFKLPAGYRPSKAAIELVWRAVPGTDQLIINPDGRLVLGGGTGAAALDGVTFT